MKDGNVERAISEVAGRHAQIQPERIVGQTQVFDPELPGVGHQNAKHGRMQVQVQMAVDMIEGQTGGAELLKLRAKLANDVDKEFSLRLSGQLDLARWIAVLSPAALYTRAAERYARTDIEEYDRYLDSVERYWKTK